MVAGCFNSLPFGATVVPGMFRFLFRYAPLSFPMRRLTAATRSTVANAGPISASAGRADTGGQATPVRSTRWENGNGRRHRAHRSRAPHQRCWVAYLRDEQVGDGYVVEFQQGDYTEYHPGAETRSSQGIDRNDAYRRFLEELSTENLTSGS